MRMVAILLIIAAVVFFGMGMYKLNVYDNGESYRSDGPKNAYVGGDAYNFIINSGQATAYFVLSAGLVIAGFIAMAVATMSDAIERQDELLSWLKQVDKREQTAKDSPEVQQRRETLSAPSGDIAQTPGIPSILDDEEDDATLLLSDAPGYGVCSDCGEKQKLDRTKCFNCGKRFTMVDERR